MYNGSQEPSMNGYGFGNIYESGLGASVNRPSAYLSGYGSTMNTNYYGAQQASMSIPAFSQPSMINQAAISQQLPPPYTAVVQYNPNEISYQQQQQPLQYSNNNASPPQAAQIASGTSNKSNKWPRRSVKLICPRCGALVTTRVERTITVVTLIVAILLCCCTCLLGLLPFCLPICKRTTHVCPYCKTVLGKRRALI